MINVKRSSFKREIVEDCDTDPSYLDEPRLADYRDGKFRFIGVRAVATLMIPDGTDFVCMKVKSPGLYGIESDSGDYLDEVFKEECTILVDLIDGQTIKVLQ